MNSFKNSFDKHWAENLPNVRVNWKQSSMPRTLTSRVHKQSHASILLEMDPTVCLTSILLLLQTTMQLMSGTIFYLHILPLLFALTLSHACYLLIIPRLLALEMENMPVISRFSPPPCPTDGACLLSNYSHPPPYPRANACLLSPYSHPRSCRSAGACLLSHYSHPPPMP